MGGRFTLQVVARGKEEEEGVRYASSELFSKCDCADSGACCAVDSGMMF